MSGRYFCHQCSVEIAPTNVQTDPTCPTCNGGFVEEIEITAGAHSAHSKELNVGLQIPSEIELDIRTCEHAISSFHKPTRVQEVQPLPFMGLFGAHGGLSHGHSHSHSPHPGTYVFRMRSSGPGASGSSGGIEFHFDSGPTPGSEGSSATGGQAEQRRPVGIEAIFNLLGNLGMGGLGMPSAVHGNPGDYVWGAGGLDAIITQLLNNVEGAGPPPADPEKIKNLPSVKINSTQVEKNVQCFVCFDDFTLDEEVKVLPCRHHYHHDCIIPWLERHGTCPVCRKDLNGSDTTTTEFDANIGETIGSLETADQQPVDVESMDTETAESSGGNANNSSSFHDDDID